MLGEWRGKHSRLATRHGDNDGDDDSDDDDGDDDGNDDGDDENDVATTTTAPKQKKRCENRTKRPENDPKRFENGPKMIRKRFASGPNVGASEAGEKYFPRKAIGPLIQTET